MKKYILQPDKTLVTGSNLIDVLNSIEQVQNINEGLKLIDENQYYPSLYVDISSIEVEVYKICKNWLKSRDGEHLNNEEAERYQSIVILLKEIVKLMEEVTIRIRDRKLKNTEIFNKVRSIVAQKLVIPPDKITLIANYASDLGADSLDIGDLFLALEEAFKIKFPNKVTDVIITVQQTIDYINGQVESDA